MFHIQKPSDGVYTIYTKSNCTYCVKVKDVLQKEPVVIVNCDAFLENDRDAFLETMDALTGTIHRTFPFVFHNLDFIGGCDNTIEYYEKMNLSFNDEF